MSEGVMSDGSSQSSRPAYSLEDWMFSTLQVDGTARHVVMASIHIVDRMCVDTFLFEPVRACLNLRLSRLALFVS
jgi:hypothetical protein